MPYRFDLHVQLEAVHTLHSPIAVKEAVRAETHDPLWFLGRQWQLGEHRGSDAASPIKVHCSQTQTPITSLSTAPSDDPQITPPEVLLESEAQQWWTIGRRLRVGQGLAAHLSVSQRSDPALQVSGLVAPYERFNKRALDGLTLYRRRQALSLPDDLFAEQGVPLTEPADNWRSDQLHYSGSFAAGPTTLNISQHDGADVDWYSVVATGKNPPAQNPTATQSSYASPVTYPGAPQPRWWQIEDHRYDPGALAPHRTHLASLLMIQATASHGDDWFTAPLLCPTATLINVRELQVEDSMGLVNTCSASKDWSMFHISGRPTNELLLWPAVSTALSAHWALDDVVLGVDEDANVLWAIERRADGEVLSEDESPEFTAEPDETDGQVVLTGSPQYRYEPSSGVPRFWHPYIVTESGGQRRYVQGAVADLTVRPVVPQPEPISRLLRNQHATPSDPIHELALSAVPRQGLRLERRYALTRTTQGEPALWVQRLRLPLTESPTSSLRFDTLQEIPELRE